MKSVMQTAVDLLPKIKNSVGKLERDKDLIFKNKLTEQTGKKKTPGVENLLDIILKDWTL